MNHVWLAAVVAASVKALFHGALELVGYLGVSVSVEDTPGLERRLREHLSLDFAVDLSCILLDVEGGWVATGAGSHEEVSSLVLVAGEFRRVLVELQVPQLLLLQLPLQLPLPQPLETLQPLQLVLQLLQLTRLLLPQVLLQMLLILLMLLMIFI